MELLLQKFIQIKNTFSSIYRRKKGHFDVKKIHGGLQLEERPENENENKMHENM